MRKAHDVLTSVRIMDKSPSRVVPFFAILLIAACGTEAGDDDETLCEAGQCDGLPFLDQLKGREDPIGKWLRSLAEAGVIDKKGVYHGAKAKNIAPKTDDLFYAKLLDGIATVQGCKPQSLINYAISDDLISGDPGSYYPRLVSTLCSDNNDLVANAFVATLGSPHRNGTGDLELDDLEAFAWDATAQKYFFYATKIGAKDGDLNIEVEPARCMQCHLSPLDVDPIGMPRLPIMNELTKPWTHWNAGSGGVSESFEVPTIVKGKPNWEKFGVIAAAASRLEKVIRDANALRVTPARSKTMFRPAKIDEAMGLIRPLFCDEQVQYVSELATGELSTDAVISGGLKGSFRSIQSTWPWDWFNSDNIQLPAATEGQRLFMMPVRGVAEITFEPQLQAVLTAPYVLAVRALDWKKPVFSDFRCNLWKDAWVAFKDKPPALTGRNRDAIKIVYEEIMKRGGMSTRNLASGKFVALADASAANVTALKEAIAAGTVPKTCGEFCEVDAMGFGNAIDSHVNDLSSKRTELRTERDRRICKVKEEVAGVGAHATHGRARRISNEPSFMRVAPGAEAGTDTTPSCP